MAVYMGAMCVPAMVPARVMTAYLH